MTRTRWQVRVDDRLLTISSLDKLYWPEDGISKADYLAYCRQMSPWILPHWQDRPLVLVRYPQGTGEPGFYQKNAPEPTPPWVTLHPYWSSQSQRNINFVMANDAATIIWLANQGVLEFHPWMSRRRQLHRPDYAVVDIDPAEGTGFEEARQVAFMLKELMDFLGLRGYPKLSGATGIHVLIPLLPRYNYDTARRFVRDLALVLRTLAPELITLERAVHKRAKKVYIDFLQNGLGKTVVGVYSTRARPGAAVSFPLKWEDLQHSQPEDFTLRTAYRWVERLGDPLAPALADHQPLEPVLEKLKGIAAARKLTLHAGGEFTANLGLDQGVRPLQPEVSNDMNEMT